MAKVQAKFREVFIKCRWLGLLLTAGALAGLTGTAQAGVVRFAGKQIDRASTAVAHTARAGGSAAAGGVATAGKATGQGVAEAASATGKGTVTLAKGAKAVPGEAARGTEKVAKAMWKAIW